MPDSLDIDALEPVIQRCLTVQSSVGKHTSIAFDSHLLFTFGITLSWIETVLTRDNIPCIDQKPLDFTFYLFV